MKHRIVGILVAGCMLLFCAGCIVPHSQESPAGNIQIPPTTATAITPPSGINETGCPVLGNAGHWIQVDPVAWNHSIGESLIVTGTTNIQAGDRLRVIILPPIRGIRTRGEQYCDNWEGVTSIIQQGNCSTNTW